jgi:hypothetical protein
VICNASREDPGDVRVASDAPNLASFRFDVARTSQPSSIRIEADYEESDFGDDWRVQRELKIEYPRREFTFDAASRTFTNDDQRYRLPDGFRIEPSGVDGDRPIFEVWSPGAAASSPGVEMVLAGPAPALPNIATAVEPFLIDRYEVTAGRLDAYARQAARSGVRVPVTDEAELRAARGVLFETAVEFARSEGKRPPTEAQWKVAAYWDGTRLRTYPWGDDWKWENAYQVRSNTNSPPLVTECLQDRSHCGAIGMASGVREWIDRGAPGSSRQPVLGYHSMYSASGDPARAVERNQATFQCSCEPDLENAIEPVRQVGFRCVLPLLRS